MVQKGHETQVPLVQEERPMPSSMQNNSDITIEKGKGKNIIPKDPPLRMASQPSTFMPTS